MFTRLKAFIESLDPQERERRALIADERREGSGNALRMEDMSGINIMHTDDDSSYFDIYNAHDAVLDNPYELVEMMGLEEEPVGADVVLYTNQEYLSGTALEGELRHEGEPPFLGYDKKGRLWILDGHHRIAKSRMAGEESLDCYVLTRDTIDEIEYLWYTSEDDEGGEGGDD